MRRMLAPLAVTLVALAAVLAPGAGASSSADKNLVATAAGAGQFKTLASLLTKSGLAMTLEGKGPYTVFAPTDTAFAKVPKATLAKLGKDKALLRSVLLYHVVKGKVPASTVVMLNGKSAKTSERRLREDRRPRRHGLPERIDQGDQDRRDGVQRHHPCHRQGAAAARELTLAARLQEPCRGVSPGGRHPYGSSPLSMRRGVRSGHQGVLARSGRGPSRRNLRGSRGCRAPRALAPEARSRARRRRRRAARRPLPRATRSSRRSRRP